MKVRNALLGQTTGLSVFWQYSTRYLFRMVCEPGHFLQFVPLVSPSSMGVALGLLEGMSVRILFSICPWRNY